MENSAPNTSAVVTMAEEVEPRAYEPLGGKSTIGGALAVARHEGHDVVLVADADARAVRVVDAATLVERSHLTLSGRPAQVVVAGDGRVYVALPDRNQVVALEMRAGQLARAATLATATEPVALATDAAGGRLLVVSAWGAELASFDVATHAQERRWKLGREPRAVAVSADGLTAHVAHAVGSRITRVSLRDVSTTEIALGGTDFSPAPVICGGARHPPPPPPPRHLLPNPGGFKGVMLRSGMGNGIPHERNAVQGYALALVGDRVVVPLVLAHEQTLDVGGGYGTNVGYPPHQPALAVVADDVSWLRVANNVFRADEPRSAWLGDARRSACFLPRAAAADANSQTVLVTCLGTNELHVLDADVDTNLTRGTRARWKVPAGAIGVVVDVDRGRALVWSQYTRELAAVPLPLPAPAEDAQARAKRLKTRAVLPDAEPAPTVVSLGQLPSERSTLSEAAQKGRELFHAAGDLRISLDGRTCASCHPDGRDDGLVWPTPFGVRQTPMLAGRLGEATAPFGWHGDEKTVSGHVRQTFTRLMGQGLEDDDLAALIAYCHEMEVPPVPAAAPDAAWVARGKELFFADTVGCATCHVGGGGTDGNRHAVGSGPKLDTPSLRFVAGTAPYFHDARYQTLTELLTHSQGQMGWAKDMPADDLQALEAFVRTL